MWCETVRPEAIPYLLDTEEHALSAYRYCKNLLLN